MEMRASLLYHDAAERERLLDVNRRLRRPYACAVAVMCLPIAVGGPVYGWLPGLPLLAAVAFYALCMTGMDRMRRPELALVASCAFAELMMFAVIALADGGPPEYLYAMTVFPMVGAAAVFGRPVALTGAALTAGGLSATALLTNFDGVYATPSVLLIPVLLLITTTLACMATRDADVVTRGTAVVDPLTGLPNRVALNGRAAELTLQSRATGELVALVVADVDHFKAVNDEHGHAVGDDVLVEVARRLREACGPDANVYRFGGEEFVILLSGAHAAMAAQWAERLRAELAATPIAGLGVTASFGVAASAPGGAFDFRTMFVLADAALYDAKAAGRNRVASASPLQDGPTAGERREITVPAPTGRPPADLPAGPDGWDVELVARRSDGNWLVPDAIQRAQIVDVFERTRTDSQVNALLLFAGVFVGCFQFGWWQLLPVVIGGVVWDRLAAGIPRSRRPEFAALFGLVLILVASGIGVAVCSPSALFALQLLALTPFAACASFPDRGAVLLALSGVLTVVAVAFGVDAAAVWANPMIVALPVALILALSFLGAAMGRAARENRVAAISDPLTGTLNRAALEARVPELEQIAENGRQSVSLLMVDLDHFKAVNDDYGHETGDVVLSEVAYRLRASVRAFDSVYRIGGEEFVVILLDTEPELAGRIADRIRTAVEGELMGGVRVTVSIGLATSRPGFAFDYEAILGAADTALYAAKAAGRNRVAGAPLPAVGRVAP